MKDRNNPNQESVIFRRKPKTPECRSKEIITAQVKANLNSWKKKLEITKIGVKEKVNIY